MFGFGNKKKKLEDQLVAARADKLILENKIKSLFWNIAHQGEKVPGSVNKLVDDLYPDSLGHDSDTRHRIAKQIKDVLYYNKFKEKF